MDINALANLGGMINWIMIFLIIVYVAQGFYKGFLVSAANTVGMFISMLLAYLCSPLMSKAVADGALYRFLIYFTNGVDTLQDKGNLLVSGLSQGQITEVVGMMKLSPPFDTIMTQNMSDQVFASQEGVATVADYMGATITNVVVNIFSFIVIYLIARIIISLMINAVNFASPFPVLKHFDSVAGAGLGFLRGFFAMFVIAMVVPIILVSMPTDIFANIIADSSILTYFYEHNFLLPLMTGVIT